MVFKARGGEYNDGVELKIGGKKRHRLLKEGRRGVKKGETGQCEKETTQGR